MRLIVFLAIVTCILSTCSRFNPISNSSSEKSNISTSVMSVYNLERRQDSTSYEDDDYAKSYEGDDASNIYEVGDDDSTSYVDDEHSTSYEDDSFYYYSEVNDGWSSRGSCSKSCESVKRMLSLLYQTVVTLYPKVIDFFKGIYYNINRIFVTAWLTPPGFLGH